MSDAYTQKEESCGSLPSSRSASLSQGASTTPAEIGFHSGALPPAALGIDFKKQLRSSEGETGFDLKDSEVPFFQGALGLRQRF